MKKEGYTKRKYDGPYPEAHSIDGKKLPPDGTYQPEPDRTSHDATWQQEMAIGVSYPSGHDFGPFTHHMGEGLHTSFSLSFENDIPFSVTGVHPHTALMLFTLAFNQHPDVIVETGTHQGYSTFFFAKALELWKNGKIYTIDPNDTFIAQEVKDNPYVECIKGRSDDELLELCERVGQVDIAFIDSWKRLSLSEFATVDPFIVEGGLAIFHDTQWLNTGRTLYDILGKTYFNYDKMLFAGTPHDTNPHRYFGNADNLGLLVLRKREQDPFLDVRDANTTTYGASQVTPVDRTIRDYALIEFKEKDPC